jgi:hypothetical protein
MAVALSLHPLHPHAEELTMDFIERWLGISPDGGDGSLEAIYVIALAVLIGAVVMRRSLRRWLGIRSGT